MKSRKSATNDLIREETASGIDPADAVKYAASKYAARGMNMTERKKFIPCIYLRRGHAQKGLRDETVISDDPAVLARQYASGSADGLLVFDLSDTDTEHDAAIETIRAICAAVRVPVIGCGHVRRMEDVKKLIYAGCSMAALNYSRQGNIDLTREVSEKFGKNRIAACCLATDAIEENRTLIQTYVQEMILLGESSVRDALQIEGVPMIIHIHDVSLDKILELLSTDAIDGITGDAINSNVQELLEIKKLCAEKEIPVDLHLPAFSWSDFKKGPDGLLPVVVQEDRTGEVLMMAYMNEEAYQRTVQTGMMTYWSRSRQELWLKGETSGHYQYVRSLKADCDFDTLLARVDQTGAACHTGHHSCFFREDLTFGTQQNNPETVLETVYQVILDRREHPRTGSYTNYLFDKGIDKILKKVGEEASEIIIASKNPDKTDVVYEMSDFLYHMMVLMAQRGVTWRDITEELARREQKGGEETK